MRLLLIENGLDIHASQEEKYIFVIEVAAGKKKYNKILEWLTKYTK